MSVKLLTEHNVEFLNIKRGCTGSSESTLVKMPHCWKSRVTAHMWKAKQYISAFLHSLSYYIIVSLISQELSIFLGV